MNIIKWLKRMYWRLRFWLAMRGLNGEYLRLGKRVGAALMPSMRDWIDAVNKLAEEQYLRRTKFALNMPRKHRRGKR